MNETETVTIPREIVVAADSLLSWLWHRHVPQQIREREQREYDRIIAVLRRAQERDRELKL
jgi:hypothetical protein